MPEGFGWIVPFLIGAAILVICALLPGIGSRIRKIEEKRNGSYQTPHKHQLAWHITHTRDDVATILVLMGIADGLLFLILLLLWSKL